MDVHWPGYLHGIALGGLFVIEDWMFFRSSSSAQHDPTSLHLKTGEPFSNLKWSQAMLRSGKPNATVQAYATMSCHLSSFIGEDELQQLAAFGYNAVRLPVGYWLFDDPSLYPNDVWMQPPAVSGAWRGWGVNPDGFVTPGTRALSDMIMRLHNHNMKVILDMHAVAGCSSPQQSYAGQRCEPAAPNTWSGLAQAGVSGGHANTRAQDGKTWLQIAQTIVISRVVPWINFIDRYAPNTIVAFETVNEPSFSGDASWAQVRCLTLDLAAVLASPSCLGGMHVQVAINFPNAPIKYPTSTIAADYKSSAYSKLRSSVLTDIHHYFKRGRKQKGRKQKGSQNRGRPWGWHWSGCIDWSSKLLKTECVCRCGGLKTTAARPIKGATCDDEHNWASYTDAGVFEEGWRYFIGEWTAVLHVAHSCNPNGGPMAQQTAAMWLAQKWNYLSLYASGRSAGANSTSSFVGDFYWTARMGYNWNPDPSICADNTPATKYKDPASWDWSMIRLIELGLVTPLSKLGGPGGLTPSSLTSLEASACGGSSFRVHCPRPRASRRSASNANRNNVSRKDGARGPPTIHLRQTH